MVLSATKKAADDGGASEKAKERGNACFKAKDFEKAERHYQKNHDVVRVVFDEDFAIGEGNPRGLATGANQHFTFGRYECGLHLGQRSIDAALADELRL